MNCNDVNRFLDQASSSSPTPASVQGHIATCAACQKLVTAFQNAATPAAPASIALPEGLLDDLKPVRRLPSSPMRVAIWLGAAAVVTALGVALWGLRGWQALTGLELLFAAGSVVVLLFSAGYGLAVQMVPGAKRRFPFFAVECAAFLVFVATVAVAFHRSYSFPLAPADRGCFINGLITSGIAALFVLPRMRRGVWLDRGAVAINVGALVSAICLLVFVLYCPVINFRHVFVAHLGAVAVVMLVSGMVAFAWREQ
ncbi:MAG TPA: NrsF family protein [Bryobacteraceae bacterium]|nr:NrsF family protein [Bryobacteraceae bacterium]